MRLKVFTRVRVYQSQIRGIRKEFVTFLTSRLRTAQGK